MSAPAPRQAVLLLREPTMGDVPALARVHVDTWRHAYRGIVPQAHLDGLTYASYEERWRRILADATGKRFVAEIDGDVIGFVAVGALREPVPGYTGEVRAIYVRPEAQGRGAGRALLREGAGSLARQGHRTMLLWVLADNKPGRAFYERLGGRVVAEQAFEIGGAALREVAYGWDDLGALAAGD